MTLTFSCQQSVYAINKIIHGSLEVQNFSASVQLDISQVITAFRGCSLIFGYWGSVFFPPPNIALDGKCLTKLMIHNSLGII